MVNIKGTCSKTCPSDWELIGSNCYYFSSSSETWKRSKEICAGSNGILAVIKDESEMTSLLPIIMEERYWIGLRRDPKNTTMWLWTDGSPLTYSVWMEGEPSNYRGNEHCVEIIGKLQAWNDLSCQDHMNYIFCTPEDDDDDDDYENTNPCDPKPALPSRTNRRMNMAIKDDLPLKCMNEPSTQCPSVWTTPQKGMIPKEMPRFQPPPIGLDFSSGAVNAAFSDIAASNTFPELEVMSRHNKQRPGRSKMVVLAGLMVILVLALAGVTVFISLRYIAVAEKVADLEETVSDLQKNTKSERGDLKAEVAALNNTMVKLQDMIVVNIKQINKVTKTLENICTRCPVGWYMNGSSCYYVSVEKVTWDEARDECYKMNSVLVMVKDRTESEALKKLFKENRRYWIGLRRDPKEVHIWKWLDGEQVTFTNWGVNEPNYYSNVEHCGETISGPWNDRSCADKINYICKKIQKC